MKIYNTEFIQDQISLLNECPVVDLESDETIYEDAQYVRQEIEGQISLNI